MNKPPQPIAGPPSVPHPAPSPGLTSAVYPPGQPASVVFANQPPPMNSAPQPRQFAPGPRALHQQSFYPRGTLQSSAPRVGASNQPRPVPSSHVYPPNSPMVMIPQQQIPFPPNSQGHAYFIQPGQVSQYRGPYVHQTQQYSVASAPTSFYPPGTNPDYSSSYAGAYYPAQTPYQPSVPTPPVMMNPAQQQQAPPPQQQAPPQQHKRERKQIRIRDPNQGGKDITEEIMSGARTTSTPTPPHSVGAEVSGTVQANGETVTPAAPVVRFDDHVKSSSPAAPASTPPPRSDPSPEPKSVPDVPAAAPLVVPVPPGQSEDVVPDPSPSSSPAPTALPTEPTTNDSVDAPEPPEAAPQKVEEEAPESNAALPEQPCAHVKEAEPEKTIEPCAETPLSAAASTAAPAEEDTPPTAAAAAAANGETESDEVTPSPAPTATPVPEPASIPMANGLPQEPEELQEEKLEPEPEPAAEPEVPEIDAKTSTEEQEEEQVEDEPAPAEETTMQAVLSMPKKKKLKKSDLNNKVVGDVLDAYKEPEEKEAVPEPAPVEVQPSETRPIASPTPEETDETWEEKEDKLETENIDSDSEKPVEQKYQYKEEHWKPINPEEKKRYDREFLLGFQFISASMHKPEGLPHITDVVLDKANKTPLRPMDPNRLMNCGPDFTPSFANLGRAPLLGGRGPPPGPRRSQQGQRKEPRKIIASVSLNDDIQLNKAEKAWKPAVKKSRGDEDDPESLKTQELFKRVRSVLNKLTPQMFQQLMKQVTELTIDTEERLKGVIDLIFEKAISEPNFSVAYANMCRCLMGLKVPTTDKPGATVNFRKLLLNRCQKEFEKDKDDDEIFEQKQKELDAATEEEIRQRLKEELEEAKDQARRRSLGNIKFIGELFKLKMLTEPIMHDCIVKLLKNHDEESLECLCRLLSTIGKDLDFEKAKPRMDQYFHQMEKIIKEKKTSSRIRFMLQDVIDLRKNNWVPRRGDQGPKTIDQIHKEAELEEHREHAKVQQQLLSKKDSSRGRGGRMNQPQDEGWNTVPISTKNRPIDTSRLSKITKPGALDFNNQLLAPGGKGSWGSWGKGSSGGSGAKTTTEQDAGRPATSTLNRFSALQQAAPSSTSSSSSMDSERRVPQRNSSSRDRSERDRFDRLDRRDSREDRDRGLDRTRATITKRSFSRESEDRSRAGDVRRVSSMIDERERGSRDRTASREAAVKRETAPTPPPPAPSKPALSEEELEKKSTAIIEEYLHINDLKEAVQCVQELNSASVLYVFVRVAVESTLERSTIAREHMGLLLHKLISAAILPSEQYYKGLQEILEVADDMAIDIPHIWLYLAEIISPMLHEGGIPMGPLFREVAKPLLPIGKAAVLLVHILNLLCKGLSHKKAGALWSDAGLNWKDFLAEDEDVNKFVTEQKVEFTLGEETEKPSKKELSVEEMSKNLDWLIQDKASNQRIHDWVEANLNEQQMISNSFVRALMTSVCQAAIICDNPYKVDVEQITQRAKLLQKYLMDEQKELQALYALQALMVRLEQPASLLRMFFDVLYDEDVIKEEAFYKWETSKDPAEQVGKGVALKSVTAFFTWLREAEEESDNS
ncbi:eukaryotic translation initiation factor 4 gamma 1a isoform X1 [Clarias gariepinus]|uniref:eukaryotic translation initiation factor 4 gamma 1a isoform X1 n=1 Tax=Clarias gariepinus TaxID=13013 RepID=UPI00234D2432|nr:eukaryotic translation initiation factor 4 gamma 1a isoform X1 [Clarias gariepinus]